MEIQITSYYLATQSGNKIAFTLIQTSEGLNDRPHVSYEKCPLQGLSIGYLFSATGT